MKTTLAIIVIIALVVLGFYTFSADQVAAPADETSTQTETSDASPDTDTQTSANEDVFAALVTYTDSGFSPTNTTVRKGEAVRFANQSSRTMWVASAVHPTHATYDGTSKDEHCAAGATASFDSCRALSAGEFWEFTFDKVGTWGYHNHVSSSATGKITVTE